MSCVLRQARNKETARGCGQVCLPRAIGCSWNFDWLRCVRGILSVLCVLVFPADSILIIRTFFYLFFFGIFHLKVTNYRCTTTLEWWVCSGMVHSSSDLSLTEWNISKSINWKWQKKELFLGIWLLPRVFPIKQKPWVFVVGGWGFVLSSRRAAAQKIWQHHHGSSARLCEWQWHSG